MFIKLNNDDVTIKRRGCANKSKQRNWLSKEDTMPPTMYTKGFMLSCMIGAIEGRDAAPADIPGDFLKTDYYKGDIHIMM